MPRIKKEIEILPSKSFQKLWLNTRKAKKIYGGVSMPGFYNTSGFSIDAIMFLIALGLEILGVYNLMILGDFAITMALGLILIDVLAAFFAHFNQSIKIEMQNRIIVETDPFEQSQHKRKMNGWKKIVSFIAKFIIIGLAIIKIFLFMGLIGFGTFNGLVLFIIVTYFIVAYIHIYHTGYFLYEIISSVKYKSEINDKTRIITEPKKYDFVFDKELNEFENNGRKLYLDPNSNSEKGKFNYKFESMGIFDDEDVSLFVGQQKNENRAKFSIECLKFQLTIFDESN